MTAPLVDPRPVDDPELQELLDDESLAYELAAEEDVTGGFAAAVGLVLAGAAAGLAVALALPGVALVAAVDAWREQVSARLLGIIPDMGRRLAEQVQRGVALGYRQATGEQPPADLDPDEELAGIIGAVDQRARDQLALAATLARTLPADDNLAGVIVGTASRAVSVARSDVRWATNRAVNVGTTAAADQLGLKRVWVAERDACLHCLAYSGQITDDQGRFPPGLTFAAKPLKLSLAGYDCPPAHPSCRCRCWPYDGTGPVMSANVPNADVATALAREARRSVLRGWSDYASQPERLRSAERLLARGAALPKTVQRRAATDVARGRFSQRHVPTTTLRA